VKAVHYGQDRQTVIARALVDRGSETFFRQDTRVWLVSPEFNLSGVRNLDTVISGPYIEVMPGTGEMTTELAAAETPPLTNGAHGGLDIVLETATLGSLQRNSPVYYRQVPVGYITGVELSPSAQQVWVHVSIKKPYDALIHENTRFWNSSGIRVDAGLFSGLKVDTESVEAIIAGGISLATPEGSGMGGEAQSGQHFVLRDKAENDWLTWSPAIPLEKENHIVKYNE
jgi:paraquat-inducible protein B